MAEIVGVFAVPHTPLLWRALETEVPEDLSAVDDNLSLFREQLAQTRAETVVIVSSDHLRQYVIGTIPAFVVGRGPMMAGTHPDEIRAFGLPSRQVVGDPEVASWLLGRHELPEAFDYAFSDELWLDHGFMVPLLYLMPELDVPVVPIHANTMALPIPGAARFASLGNHLRAAIGSAPSDKRVAVVVSGHLATEIGGPRQFTGGSPDPDFDELGVAMLASGDLDQAIETCTFERLVAAGNMTHQYLNLVTGLAAAGGVPATFAEGTPSRYGNLPFLSWLEGAP